MKQHMVKSILVLSAVLTGSVAMAAVKKSAAKSAKKAAVVAPAAAPAVEQPVEVAAPVVAPVVDPAASSMGSNSASSQATETKAKMEEVVKAPETPAKKEGEKDADDVITNRKLRAETGSKKTYSFAATLSYTGGTINSPLADNRPNITGALGTPLDPRLGGNVGGKYRISPLQTLSATIGVGVDKPFHSDEKKSFGDRASANNPTISYQQVYKVAGIQNVSTLSTTGYTAASYREFGTAADIGATQTVVYDFGGSKFSIGTSLQAYALFYDKDQKDLTPKLANQQADFKVGVFPFLEYVISDNLNLRTLIGQSADHKLAEPNFYTWKAATMYQSVGLGITIARDFYLYPNVQFMPEDIRDDRTNVGLTATINL